ncbi:hypothetical protein [Actinomadura sp. NEAU-AAG7]|uniref:hypothetical protein n=1 Tax=Actinomadura sp. NEAU-AAG7 TaxID=2839640 RepID=UPI001BE410B7|nr:hypothetical protein [Actinomadura sp. NEAU-AAG7]MBT2206976.1 hypothetical protein [Actinomadura sp. NEAU-AAG7]
MDTTPTTLPVRVHTHYRSVKKLGSWTEARAFEVRGRRGSVVLDLRSPLIGDGDIEIDVDLDHSMLKLLVPEDANIDHWDLRFAGRGRVKDWTGRGGEGRRVVIRGEMRHAEIRVHRGGIATLSAMFTREYVKDVRRAHREGGFPTIDDPTRVA